VEEVQDEVIEDEEVEVDIDEDQDELIEVVIEDEVDEEEVEKEEVEDKKSSFKTAFLFFQINCVL
jgi:hypothetical protein